MCRVEAHPLSRLHAVHLSPSPPSQLLRIRCLCLGSNSTHDITFQPFAVAALSTLPTLRPLPALRSPMPTSQLPDIRCLCLASNDINDITFEALALALTYKDAPAGLEEMDLTQNQLSVGGVQRLLPLLNKVRVGLGVERALDD